MRDARLAVRSLLRAPAFTTTAVLSLALAVGGSAAAFSVLDAVRFRALPFRDADRLVLVSEIAEDPRGAPGPARAAPNACQSACAVAYDTYAQVLSRYPFRSLDAISAYSEGLKGLASGRETTPVTVGVVSSTLFGILGAHPILGRAFAPDDDRLGVPLVTVMGYDVWQAQFAGDPGVVGQTVKLSDSRYVIIGVMPPGFRFETGSQFWLPAVPTLDPSTRPSIRSVTVIGRLARGRTLDQLRQELTSVQPVTAAPRPGAVRTVLAAEPLRARYVTATQSHDVIFAAIVGCLLLIASSNLASLILVRALHRQQEFAVRTALGASGWRVTREFLAQNVIVVVAAALIGLLLAAFAVEALRSFTALDTLRADGMDYRVDGRVVAFTALVGAVLAVLLSVIPARLMSTSDVQQVLRETAGKGARRVLAQRAFVAVQIAFTLVLLTGAALMAKSALHFGRVPLGFDAARMVSGSPSFPHPWRVPEKYVPLTQDILSQLRAIPGVAGAAVRSSQPVTAGSLTLRGASDPMPAGQAPPQMQAVTPGYFTTLGVRILSGREFQSQDGADGAPVAIVNQWAARHWWPQQSPIGQIVRIDTGSSGGGVSLTIVGVVADNRAAQPNVLLADDGPELYRPYLQSPSPFPVFLVRASAAPAPLLRPVRDVLVRMVPDRPVFAALPSETVAQQLHGVRTSAVQVLSFAVAGLVLALIGVYGVLAYEVGQRRREIGIRTALGASRRRITAMMLLEAGKLATIGVLVGLPAAMIAMGTLRDVLHPTSPTDATVYAMVGAVTVLVAVLAAWVPARRAARVDPVIAMKGDA